MEISAFSHRVNGALGGCGVVDATGFSLGRDDSGGRFSMVYSPVTHTQYIHTHTQ